MTLENDAQKNCSDEYEGTVASAKRNFYQEYEKLGQEKTDLFVYILGHSSLCRCELCQSVIPVKWAYHTWQSVDLGPLGIDQQRQSLAKAFIEEFIKKYFEKYQDPSEAVLQALLKADIQSQNPLSPPVWFQMLMEVENPPYWMGAFLKFLVYYHIDPHQDWLSILMLRIKDSPKSEVFLTPPHRMHVIGWTRPPIRLDLRVMGTTQVSYFSGIFPALRSSV